MGTSRRWSATRPDRVELAPCCLCDVTVGTCRGDGFVHFGRRWAIGITWPGSAFGSTASLLSGVCQATVEDRYVPTGDDCDLAYRGACAGCGWASPRVHDDSNAALDDALDHALAGWRRVPVVERIAHDAPPGQHVRWLGQLAELYTSLGLDARLAPGSGGVIRTLRQPMGTRSHWSHGFYDVCAGVVDERPVPVPAAQLELF